MAVLRWTLTSSQNSSWLKHKLRTCANRSRSATGSGLPAVVSPGFSEEPPYDDDHVGKGNPEINDSPFLLGAPHELLMGIAPGVSALDGLIAKDKFCMIRHRRLLLRRSRRRTKATNPRTDGPAYPPAGITQHGGAHEAPMAGPQRGRAASGRSEALGPSVPVRPAVDLGSPTSVRSERER
jgi:hypothetical protein